MSTEAQKRASKKYYLAHKKYYSEKSNENQKKTRKERRNYKERVERAIEYIKEHTYHDTPRYNGTRIMEQGYLVAKNDFWYEDLLNILQNGDDK